jgi:hypothetical protein
MPNSKEPLKLTPRQVKIAEKEANVFSLRMAGASFQAIADRVGYSGPSGAYAAFQNALRRLVVENPDEARLMELVRLDAVQIETFRMAQQGQLSAVDRYLKISEARRKLTGLDAPQKIDVETPGGPIVVREIVIRGPDQK